MPQIMQSFWETDKRMNVCRSEACSAAHRKIILNPAHHNLKNFSEMWLFSVYATWKLYKYSTNTWTELFHPIWSFNIAQYYQFMYLSADKTRV